MMIVEKNKIICSPKNSERIYFIDGGYLCCALKNKKGVVWDSTIRKLGLYEGEIK